MKSNIFKMAYKSLDALAPGFSLCYCFLSVFSYSLISSHTQHSCCLLRGTEHSPNSGFWYFLFPLLKTFFSPNILKTLFHAQVSEKCSLTTLSKIVPTLSSLTHLCFLWKPNSISLSGIVLSIYLCIVHPCPTRIRATWGWGRCLLCLPS